MQLFMEFVVNPVCDHPDYLCLHIFICNTMNIQLANLGSELLVRIV
jgi:hypothetical protein